MKKRIFNVSALTAFLVPAIAFAQHFGYINSWIAEGITLLKLAITVITILMTVFFLYNVLRFIMNTDSGKTAELKSAMIRGLIGLFISVAVWGIIDLAANITDVNTGPNPTQNITCPPGLVPINGICGTPGGGAFH